jgi:hypothetical protein
VLFCITATTNTMNVGLQTQQGIIYGRQTQTSIEYLGYNKPNSLINFPLIHFY